MSCVHHYFSRRIGEFIDHLEDEVVKTVLTAPGVQIPPDVQIPAGLQIHPMRPHPIAAGNGPRNVDGNGDGNDDSDKPVFFDTLDLQDLDIFSDNGRFRSSKTIGYLASLGLSFLTRLVLADADQRKGMIRENTPLFRDFLPEALTHTPSLCPTLSFRLASTTTNRHMLTWAIICSNVQSKTPTS